MLLEEATTVQGVYLYYILPLHVSAFAGHLQADYTIFWEAISLTTDSLQQDAKPQNKNHHTVFFIFYCSLKFININISYTFTSHPLI
jgi:hypothetical protein